MNYERKKARYITMKERLDTAVRERNEARKEIDRLREDLRVETERVQRAERKREQWQATAMQDREAFQQRDIECHEAIRERDAALSDVERLKEEKRKDREHANAEWNKVWSALADIDGFGDKQFAVAERLREIGRELATLRAKGETDKLSHFNPPPWSNERIKFASDLTQFLLANPDKCYSVSRLVETISDIHQIEERQEEATRAT